LSNLYLFDIDGTLLNAGDLAVKAYEKALQSVIGIPLSIRDVPCAGRTDPVIIRELLEKNNQHHHITHEILNRIFTCFVTNIKEEVDKGYQVPVIAGVKESLTYLINKKNVCLGILTGNLQEGATHKLRAAGLFDYFDTIGAYGSDDEDRNQLGPIALKRATDFFQVNFKPEQVFIVGDSEYDIDCARAAGFKVIAVASGKNSRQELKAKSPDILVNELSPKIFDEKNYDNFS